MTNEDPTFDGVAERRSHRDRMRNFRPAAVYKVNDNKLSIMDLLDRFSEERFQDGTISRLADMHLKVGEAVRYRLDHDLRAPSASRPSWPRRWSTRCCAPTRSSASSRSHRWMSTPASPTRRRSSTSASTSSTTATAWPA